MRGSNKRSCCIVSMAMIGILGFVGSPAQAANVYFDLQVDAGGTFELYALASLGDNYGLAYYNIPLGNILTASDVAPKGMHATTYQSMGFQGKGLDLPNTSVPEAQKWILFSYQPDNAAQVLYGIGQTAGSFPLLAGPPSEGVPWAASVLLATGTYDTNGPTPGFGTPADIKANLYNTDDGCTVDAATVYYSDLLDFDPIADAGGPYVIDEGQTLTLDATESWHGYDIDITSYSWDLDNDGSYETAGDSTTVLSYSYLTSLGLDVGGPYDISLEVWDDLGLSDRDYTQLTITPEPATLGLLLIGGLTLLRRRRSRC